MSIENYKAGRCCVHHGEIFRIEVPWNGEYAVARFLVDGRPVLLRDPREDHDYEQRYKVMYELKGGNNKELWVTARTRRGAAEKAVELMKDILYRNVCRPETEEDWLCEMPKPIKMKITELK